MDSLHLPFSRSHPTNSTLLECFQIHFEEKKIDLEFSIHSMQNFESKKLLDPDV